MWKFSFIFLMLALGDTAAAADDLGVRHNFFKAKKIEIQGLHKVEKEAVLEKINLRPGMTVDNYILRDDLKKMYGLKFFEKVEAYQTDDATLLFKVQERPILAEIVFTGNSAVNEDDLKAAIKSKRFGIVDIDTIKSDVAALLKLYEKNGHYLANVNYELKALSPERVRLNFQINEAHKVKVKKITFLGNASFSDEQLKSIMETREDSIFSFLTKAGNFQELAFKTDIEKLKYFYQTKGHLQVNVGAPEVSVTEDKRWIFITIKVTEGPQFSVNQVSFEGDMLFTSEELQKEIKTKAGEIYSEDQLRLDIQRLTEMYQDKGHAFANVLRTISLVPGENKVNIEFSFEKGKIAYFGNINIKGNNKTRDKVIRRELEIQEGEIFSGTKLRLSKEQVERLGFFEPGSVIFNQIPAPGKDDVLDIEITVKERNTGQISIGAGYSTATGFFTQASIAQNNFMGKGQNLSFTYFWGKTKTNFTLSFTEPYLFDTKWLAGADIFFTDNSASESYVYRTKGFALRVGYPIARYTKLFLTYRYDRTELKDDYDPTIDPKLENGVASLIRPSINYDRRNNAFEPTKGHYFNLSYEFAGLGGDRRWMKTEFDGRWYHDLGRDYTLRARLYAAKVARVGSRKVPRTEKLTLGGSRDMRGYAYEQIGPKVKATNTKTNQEQEFNQGGLFSLVSTLEVEHPLVREAGLKWVAFFDAGNVFERYYGEYGRTSLLRDYGVGIRWFSPLGIIRLGYGVPWGGPYRDEGGQFFFDIGEYF